MRGSRSQKILKWNHNRLSTYGIGNDFSKRQWQHLADQFLQFGLLRRDIKHGSLQITEKGNEVLQGAEVTGWLPEPDPAESTSKRGKFREYSTDFDSRLFELLRAKRTDLAQTGGVPPYVIFSDRSLIEMATLFPKTESSFAQISGVGKFKLEKFAAEFLPIIREYCQERGILK